MDTISETGSRNVASEQSFDRTLPESDHSKPKDHNISETESAPTEVTDNHNDDPPNLEMHTVDFTDPDCVKAFTEYMKSEQIKGGFEGLTFTIDLSGTGQKLRAELEPERMMDDWDERRVAAVEETSGMPTAPPKAKLKARRPTNDSVDSGWSGRSGKIRHRLFGNLSGR